GVGPVGGGRGHRGDHRTREGARRRGAARLPRGCRRLAQRDRGAGGRRARALATEGLAEQLCLLGLELLLSQHAAVSQLTQLLELTDAVAPPPPRGPPRFLRPLLLL